MEDWDEVERGVKYRRRKDGWMVVRSVDGAIHLIPPDKSEARDEEGAPRTFDSIASAVDFADQHHPC
jgi:hypothetical protein